MQEKDDDLLSVLSIEQSKKHVEWTDQHTKILSEWADKAMCYRWMHSKSEGKYSFKSKAFTIPVIILSTLTGTANFAIDRIPEDMQSYVQIIIGSLNILAGVITTVQQFLKINELNEAHRVAALSWGKFHRNIKVELLKSPKERCDVTYLMKTSKEEFDRLIETSPPIDSYIVKAFKKEFNTKNDQTAAIVRPEICGSLTPTAISVYQPSDEELEKNETEQIVEMIRQRKEVVENEERIEKFIKDFNSEYTRFPTPQEVIENLESLIDSNLIKKWIDRNKWTQKTTTKNSKKNVDNSK